jgi:hypothetical protein
VLVVVGIDVGGGVVPLRHVGPADETRCTTMVPPKRTPSAPPPGVVWNTIPMVEYHRLSSTAARRPGPCAVAPTSSLPPGHPNVLIRLLHRRLLRSALGAILMGKEDDGGRYQLWGQF